MSLTTTMICSLTSSADEEGSCFAAVSKYFCDFCQTNYLSIHGTDLHVICRICRTLAADKRYEVIFRSLKGLCRGNQFCGQNRPHVVVRVTFARAATAAYDKSDNWSAGKQMT